MTEAAYGIQAGWHWGSLPLRTLLATLTATVLTALFWVYSIAVSPLVVPPQRGSEHPVANIPVVPQPRLNREIAEQHLQLAPWASEALYQLRTRNSFVYAQNREPVYANKDDPKPIFQTIRFSPFALVWMQNGKKEDEAPYVIVSEKALVKFAHPVDDLSNPDPGRIIGGTLEGEVKITGPDGLKILGRDFWFSETSKSLWCDSPVQFVHGPNRGRAVGLDAELIRDEVAVSKDKFAISGVKTVHLRQDVVMDLLFEEQGGQAGRFTPGAKNTDESTGQEPRQPVKVHVESKGSFTYAVDSHVATFRDDVQVIRPTEPGLHDVLFGDKLTLLFEPIETAETGLESEQAHNSADDSQEGAPGKDNIPESEQSRFQGLRSDLTFRSMHAEGKTVTLISQGNNLSARMKDLVYDIKTKVAVLTDGDSVKVLQGPDGESEIQSPEITLVHDEDGTVSSFLCKGKGWLSSRDPLNRQPKLFARWFKQMRKFPDPNSNLDIVELSEKAAVMQPDQQVKLFGDLIRFWIKPTEEEERNQYTGSEDDGRHRNQTPAKDRSDQYQLQYLIAEQNVSMVNAEMHARTKRLEADFERDTSRNPARPPVFGLEREQRSGIRLQSTSYREGITESRSTPVNRFSRNRNPANAGGSTSRFGNSRHPAESAGGQDGQSGGRTVNLDTTSGPMHVSADFIRVRVLQGENQQQSRVAEVWTKGNVQVEQSRAPGKAPLQITGDQMHVVNRGENDQVVDVLGKPAHIRDPQMKIEGNKIHLDRSGNLATVFGAGVLSLPVNRTLEGQKLNGTEWLDVWWKEEMKFDGETAQFFGDVRSVLKENTMNCDEMYVLLTKRFSFAEDNTDQEADIHRVICKDNVDFESFEYEGNRVTGVRRGSFAHFTLNQVTGETEGSGPGWISAWRRGRGNRAGLAPGASVQANSGLKPDAAEWEYIHIDFAGKMSGNTKSRFTTFQDQVEIVYGPVQQPREKIDPDALPEDGGWMRSDKLRVTQHEIRQAQRVSEKPATYIDMLAEGNARLKGRTFDARAGFINYDESKGLYLLWSLAPDKATIWRQTRIGGDRSRADAQRMEFWPARNKLKLDRTTNLQGLK